MSECDNAQPSSLMRLCGRGRQMRAVAPAPTSGQGCRRALRARGHRPNSAPRAAASRSARLGRRGFGDDAVEVAAGFELVEQLGDELHRIVVGQQRGDRRGAELVAPLLGDRRGAELVAPLLGEELDDGSDGAALPLPAGLRGLRLGFTVAGADDLIDEPLPLLRSLCRRARASARTSRVAVTASRCAAAKTSLASCSASEVRFPLRLGVRSLR
jgi:hypothetical protein